GVYPRRAQPRGVRNLPHPRQHAVAAAGAAAALPRAGRRPRGGRPLQERHAQPEGHRLPAPAGLHEAGQPQGRHPRLGRPHRPVAAEVLTREAAMTPTLHGAPLLQVAFWALLVPVAAYLLRVACGVCGEDPPSWRRAVIGLLVMAAGAYFTWDVASYLFVRMMGDDTVGVRLPPGYSYGRWLREPVGLKWAVLGIVPGVRFIPILMAVVVAGVLQVGVLEVPFRNAFAITLLQGAMTLVAMAVLAFLLTLTRGYVGQVAARPPAEEAPGPLAEMRA